jgi:glycosyltransferase involved in cell wall biosynthesis
MDGDMPDLSVIITAHNSVQYVQEAVRSALAIPDTSLEVVVWDDGSRDGSPEAVAAVGDPRVRLFRGPGEGAGGCYAFNRALQEATGTFVCRCDDDDRCIPESVARQVRWLAAHPEFDAAAGGFSTLDGAGRPVCVMDTGDTAEEITGELQGGKTRTHFNAFVIRRALLARTGGFRPFFVSAHDVDMQLRVAEAGRVWYNPWPTYSYRLHDNSHCHTCDVQQMQLYDHYAFEFQRQRRARGQDDLQLNQAPQVPSGPAVARNPAGDHIYRVLQGRMWSYHDKGHRLAALRMGLRLCRRYPGRAHAWKCLALCAVKSAGAAARAASDPEA